MDYAKFTSSPELLVEAAGGAIRVMLNRPEKRNALSRKLLAQLADVLSHIAGDASAQVVVLAASGSVFCSGLGITPGADEGSKKQESGSRQ